jgi:hypothetical protein
MGEVHDQSEEQNVGNEWGVVFRRSQDVTAVAGGDFRVSEGRVAIWQVIIRQTIFQQKRKIRHVIVDVQSRPLLPIYLPSIVPILRPKCVGADWSDCPKWLCQCGVRSIARLVG